MAFFHSDRWTLSDQLGIAHAGASRSLSLEDFVEDCKGYAQDLQIAKAFQDGFEDYKDVHEPVYRALTAYIYRKAALEWFALQADNQDLMRKRGFGPGGFFPLAFGITDEAGRLLPRQARAGLVQLRELAGNRDKLFAYLCPGGVDAEERGKIEAELDILESQPWSPLLYLDMILANWPEDQPEWDISMDDARDRVIAAMKPFAG